MPRASQPRHRGPRRPRDERANSFAMFVVMLPVIIGAFGLGVDTARNIYIRTSLQNSLDMAVVAGAGVTVVQANGKVIVDKNQAVLTMQQIYALNREDGPRLECIGSKGHIPGANQPMCWKQGTTKVTKGSVTYTIEERSKNGFLNILGIPYQEYRVTSTARINQAGQ